MRKRQNTEYTTNAKIAHYIHGRMISKRASNIKLGVFKKSTNVATSEEVTIRIATI